MDPGCDLQTVRDRVFGDNQAVIARGLKRIRQILKDPGTAMGNHGCFSMHQAIGSHHFSAVDFCEALMSQAYAKDRNSRTEMADEFPRQSSFRRRARARRNDDTIGLQCFNLVDGNLIISFDSNFGGRINFADPLDKIERKRIVIVEQKDHCALLSIVVLED